MAFSLPRFLRRTPAASLRHYFACRRISPFAQFAWDSEHADFLGALRQEIEALDDETRGQVFVDFERVDQLCDPVGQTAVYSFAATDSLLLSRIQAAECNESRGLVLLLHDEEIFDRALACSYADRKQSGRSWSCYSLATCATAMNDNERLKTLESEISGLLRQFDGTGRRLKVDYFDRQRKLAAGPTVGSVAHYCIYAEGLPETRWEFEQAEPTRHTWRPVHEGAISYSPTSSSLEVIAKGGRSVRSKIAHSYARQILGIQDHLAEVAPRKFILGRGGWLGRDTVSVSISGASAG
jgi:hypothetical protein